MKPGGDAGLLPAILAAYEREPEALPVEVAFGAGPSRMLREGRADAALLHAPPDDLDGLDTEPLLSEAPVAVLPASTCSRSRRACGWHVWKQLSELGLPGLVPTWRAKTCTASPPIPAR